MRERSVGAGFVGNIYTGQGTAGRGGSIYNTNTNAGVAVGKNNVYAGKDGTVYRYNRDSGGRVTAPTAGNPSIDLSQSCKPSSKCVAGAQRTQNFNSMRGFGGARMRGGGRRR